MIVYKALKPGNISQYQGYYWPVPQFGEPGQWVEASGELGLCSNGIHVLRTGRGRGDPLADRTDRRKPNGRVGETRC